MHDKPLHKIVLIQMVLEIQVQVWRGYVNSLMVSPSDINKQYKPAHIRYHSTSPHTIIKINGSMNMCYFPAVVFTLI